MSASATATRPDETSAGTVRRPRRTTLVAAVVAAVFALAPFVGLPVPVVLPGAISSPGSLQALAIGLVFAGVAVSYDLLFGYTGLLSFGHALFVALGAYGTNLLMERAGVGLLSAAVLAVVGAAVVATAIGAIALRSRGVAFAMVTLAFAEAFALLLVSDPLRVSGGEEGLPLESAGVPSLLLGVVNTRWLYWLALLYAVFAVVAGWQATTSRAGRVWQAIRENEARVELLGLRPFPYVLAAFVTGSTLAAVGGVVYLLLIRGVNPNLASANFTLSLLVMVVLGGAGRLWGAAIGGLVYGVLTLRLSALAGSSLVAALPAWAENVLSEPLFVLGSLFVVLMLFAPGGFAGVLDRLRPGTRGERIDHG